MRGHGLRQRLRELVVEPLERSEEERAAAPIDDARNPHRSADEAARPIVFERRLGAPRLVHEEVGRGQRVAPQVVVAFAPEAVRPALQRDVDDGALGALQLLDQAARQHDGREEIDLEDALPVLELGVDGVQPRAAVALGRDSGVVDQRTEARALRLEPLPHLADGFQRVQ